MSDGAIAVRDSKAPDCGTLYLTPEGLAQLLRRAMEGDDSLRA